MIYQGSKARLAKFIVPILQDCIDKHEVLAYVEPFVGGANIIQHIKCRERYGSDINYELIELLKCIQKDTSLSMFPEDCSFEYYNCVRQNRKINSGKFSVAYTAGIGYFASYGGRYFDGGYGRCRKRNMYRERLAYVREEAERLKGIKFSSCSYEHYKYAQGAVFYLDPPYKHTKTYAGKESFDYEAFYKWVRQISRYNYVFISEYEMPEDFKCIWSKERKVYQKSDRAKAEVATEKLFILKGGLADET